MLVHEMCHDDGDVREIEGRCGDVEDGDHCLRGTNADTVEADAEEDDEPDGVDGSVSIGADSAPESV